ncbi:MAG TPA: hypothetical protein VGM75_03545 [Pseudonocardiaceae bacterium]
MGGSASVEAASDEAAGADGGSSFSALSEFSAMLARFDDNPAPSAIELPEPSTTPLRQAGGESAASAEPARSGEVATLPEPELTPPSRAERSGTAQPFAPETMFGGRGRTEQPAGADAQPADAQRVHAQPAVGAPAVGAPVEKPAAQAGGRAADKAVELPAASVERVEKGPEPLRPSPPPTGITGITAKLAGPQDSDFDSDVASIEGRSGRGRRRTPKLGDLLTEALRAYQDVRESDESDALGSGSEPSELGATELSSWLGTGTEPLGSIDPPSWRPGSSTRSFGVARHSSGDDSGDSRRQSGSDWHPPTG